MNFGQRIKNRLARFANAFRRRKFRIPFKTDTQIFREKFQSISWKKLFDFRSWKVDRAKLEDWRANWRQHLANLPNTLSQLPSRLPQDFRLSRNTIIYINCAAVIACAYFAADLAATIVAPFLPEPPARQVVIKRRQAVDINRYDVILSRNLFDAVVDDGGTDLNGPPVKTSLPIDLIGIILVQDKLKSVASVQDRSRNDVVSVKVNEQISPEAIVQEILEDRVIFINRNTNRREYIDLPEEVKRLKTKTIGGPPVGTKVDGITKIDDSHMQVDRSEVDKALANLNTVLTQARCVPNMEGGKSAGFRCFQIVPGSIFDKIGMQDGDVVCGINGTELVDAGQALQLFEQLKTANSIELCIKRNRQTMNIQYDIQ